MSAPTLPRAEPESVGLSSARLRRIGEALRRDIEAGQLPGAVVGIMRGGKLAHLEAVGSRDPATREPLKTDSIFSIASMTKAMTSTAVMLLVEEGRVLLADPVLKYLPPLAELKVAEPGGGTRAPKQLPTIQDLLRHTSGLTYRDRGTTPAHAGYLGLDHRRLRTMNRRLLAMLAFSALALVVSARADRLGSTGKTDTTERKTTEINSTLFRCGWMRIPKNAPMDGCHFQSCILVTRFGARAMAWNRKKNANCQLR
jgi:CubicO group peptidase (beta-lactamase class C family)